MSRRLLASVGSVALIVAACGGSAAPVAPSSTDSPTAAVSVDGVDWACDLTLAGYEPEPASGDNHRRDEQGFFIADPEGVWDTCVEPGETVIAVEGLPGVSGLFRSRDVRMDLRGFGSLVPSGDSQVPDFRSGQCFVSGQDQPFQTNAVIHKTAEGSDDPAQSSLEPEQQMDVTLALTVDVGITSGDPQTPVAAVQMHTGVVMPAVTDLDLTYAYVEGPYDGPSPIMIVPKRIPTVDNPWAGYVTVTSVFHNAAEYTPYVPGENRWKGQGMVDGRITIWCGG